MMVTKPEGGREGGRPRTFSDEDVFAATTTVLARLGYGRLTLAAVAGELGCTGQALIRRFGGRRGLVRAYLAWALERTRASFEAVRQPGRSPLAALRARFALPIEERRDELPDAPGAANFLAFWIEVCNDPEFRELMARRDRLYRDGVGRLVAEARAAGELVACDPPRLADLLVDATTGAAVRSASDPSCGAVERIRRTAEAILEPYLADPTA